GEQAGVTQQRLVGRRADHERRVVHALERRERARHAHQRDRIAVDAALDGVEDDHRSAAARASSACSKQASGARAMPAPTWPTPAWRWAMPVLMAGAMPVSTTRRTSMPAGAPPNSSAGIAH